MDDVGIFPVFILLKDELFSNVLMPRHITNRHNSKVIRQSMIRASMKQVEVDFAALLRSLQQQEAQTLAQSLFRLMSTSSRSFHYVVTNSASTLPNRYGTRMKYHSDSQDLESSMPYISSATHTYLKFRSVLTRLRGRAFTTTH